MIIGRTESNGRAPSGRSSSTFSTCQPWSVLKGPPILPAPSANADSASAGCRPSAGKSPSRVTVPSEPPCARVSVSTEYFCTSSAQALPLCASFSTWRAWTSVFVWTCRSVTPAGVRYSPRCAS